MNRKVTFIILLGLLAVMVLIIVYQISGTNEKATDTRGGQTAQMQQKAQPGDDMETDSAMQTGETSGAASGSIQSGESAADDSGGKTGTIDMKMQQRKESQSAATASGAQDAESQEARNTIVQIDAEHVEGGISFRILAEEELGKYKYFVLKNPDRLVVDLIGDWKKGPKPVVPRNPVVIGVRTGLHPRWIRFVADLKNKTNYDVNVEKKSPKEMVITVQ